METTKNYWIIGKLKFQPESFVITKDFLDMIKVSKERLAEFKKSGFKTYFKIYDDDDILYFSGYLHESEPDDFTPLDWAMFDSGCTRIDYRNPETGKMETL